MDRWGAGVPRQPGHAASAERTYGQHNKYLGTARRDVTLFDDTYSYAHPGIFTGTRIFFW